MQAIDIVGGDLLNPVHLSNGFKIVEPSHLFTVSKKCQSVAKVLGVTNSDSGKTLAVTGHVLCDGKPIIQVHSLHCSQFYTFQIAQEPQRYFCCWHGLIGTMMSTLSFPA